MLSLAPIPTPTSFSSHPKSHCSSYLFHFSSSCPPHLASSNFLIICSYPTPNFQVYPLASYSTHPNALANEPNLFTALEPSSILPKYLYTLSTYLITTFVPIPHPNLAPSHTQLTFHSLVPTPSPIHLLT
jgi:hypothetical protein